ncbi:acyclic terpene utilization AtuA family protein [Streptomyces sp. NPDC127119]|uniref:acyclic terpene utilization AtuA family protein n=1 Tax=Streptomyces sp. NPDC127119 TaxID=3345370 RepID=UPI00363F1F7D
MVTLQASGSERGALRIGSGAGFADDRIEPAVQLVESGDIQYLVFECLAERSVALAELERRHDPARGYNPWLPDRMAAVLPECARRGIRVITNMGAANPQAAGALVAGLARATELHGLSVAVVTGDDVLDRILERPDLPLLEREGTVGSLGDRVVSAHAYLGCEGITHALSQGADVVITGRVADPSLYIAPLVHEFGWDTSDWNLIAKGACAGHLMECGAQVMGGYFADPGYKDVPGLADLGFPIAEVHADGTFRISKVPGSGGLVTPATCTEQLLYEVHDPSAYPSADVVADFSEVRFDESGHDTVLVRGARGRRRPDDLKVSVGYRDGFTGEGQISYAGPNALPRARLALDVLRARIEKQGITSGEARYELIGVDSVSRGLGPGADPNPNTNPDVGPGPGLGAGDPDRLNEVRVRVAGRTDSEDGARRIAHEVSAMWLNGPAGGGGVVTSVTERIAIASVFLPRSDVTPSVTFAEV